MSSLRHKAGPIVLFVLMQVASVAVLALWIVWWALDLQISNVMWLLQGIFLMVWVITTSSIIFAYWGGMRALDLARVNFLSLVSHELLTPLASLKLYIETMQLRKLTPEQQAEFLQGMGNDAERLENLIRQILVASRIERHRENYTFAVADLGSVITKYFADNGKILQGGNLELDLAENCYAQIDESSFQTVLSNLATNAVRYANGQVQLTVTLRKEEKFLLLVVRDQGQGIAKEELKKVFKLFYRATKVRGGTGLGLYIVKNVVRAHRGKVWAESDGLNQGTTIKIILPREADR